LLMLATPELVLTTKLNMKRNLKALKYDVK
jgi:hypothetical protein